MVMKDISPSAGQVFGCVFNSLWTLKELYGTEESAASGFDYTLTTCLLSRIN